MSPDLLFRMIYQAAKEKNEEQLRNALSSVSINVINSENSSVVAMLAEENDIESVNFLIKFNASTLDAMLGYAKGKHLQSAYSLLDSAQKEGSDNFGNGMLAIATGLGMGGHLQEAYAFFVELNAKHLHEEAYQVRQASLRLAVGEGLLKTHLEKMTEYLGNIEDKYSYTADNLTISYTINLFIKANNISELDLYVGTIMRNPDAVDDIGIGLLSFTESFVKYDLSLKNFMVWLEKIKYAYSQDLYTVLISSASCFGKYKSIDEAYAFLDKIKSQYPENHFVCLAHVLKGFVSRGYHQEAFKLFEQAKSERSDMDHSQIGGITECMIDGLLESGCFKEAYMMVEEFYTHKKPTIVSNDYLIRALVGLLTADYRAGKEVDKKLIVKSMLMIGSEHWNKLGKSLHDCLAMIPLADVFQKAEKLQRIMKCNDLSSNQALDGDDLAIRLFLLQGTRLIAQDKQSLSTDMFFEVTKFLSSMDRPEVYDLANKIMLNTCKARLFKNFKDHKIFLPECELMKSEAEFAKILKNKSEPSLVYRFYW